MSIILRCMEHLMHACNIWIILKNPHCLSEIQITLSSCILSGNLIHTPTPGTFPASLAYPLSFIALKINISCIKD